MSPLAAFLVVGFFAWLFYDIVTARPHEEQEEMEPPIDEFEKFWNDEN